MHLILLISLILFFLGIVILSKRKIDQSNLRFPQIYFLFSIDKFEHLITAFVGTLLLFALGHFSILEGALWAFLWGIVWEIKDGLLDYKAYGYLGGEGFDVIDLFYDVVGIVSACLITWKLS